MALPDDLSPDRDLTEEHPRRSVHGYHLLALPHGVERLAEREAGAAFAPWSPSVVKPHTKLGSSDLA